MKSETFICYNVVSKEVIRVKSRVKLRDHINASGTYLKKAIDSDGMIAVSGFRIFTSEKSYKENINKLAKNSGFEFLNVLDGTRGVYGSETICHELGFSHQTLTKLCEAKNQPIIVPGYIVKRNDGKPFRKVNPDFTKETFVAKGYPFLKVTPGEPIVFIQSVAELARYCDVCVKKHSFIDAYNKDEFWFAGNKFLRLRNIIRL